jgi:hypothetical protein
MGLKYDGLKDIEVNERIEKGLVNKAVKSQTKTNLDIVRENFFTYFNPKLSVSGFLLIFSQYLSFINPSKLVSLQDFNFSPQIFNF